MALRLVPLAFFLSLGVSQANVTATPLPDLVAAFRDAQQAGDNPASVQRTALDVVKALAAADRHLDPGALGVVPSAAAAAAAAAAVAASAASAAADPQRTLLLRSICTPLQFLWYARNSDVNSCCGGDFGAGKGHFFGWAMGCYVGEARLMGRILIYEDTKCCHPYHNSGILPAHRCHLGDFIDEEHFRERVPAITEQEFLSTCGQLTAMYKSGGGGSGGSSGETGTTGPFNVMTISGGNRAAVQSKAMLVRRIAWGKEGNTYWANVCDTIKAGPDHVAITNLTSFSFAENRDATHLGAALAARYRDTLLRPPLITVHARRGDKISWRESWPRNDQCTSPGRIFEVLQERKVPWNTTVYVASNEYEPGFFLRPPLASAYVVVTWHQIPELVALANTKPYLLYSIEQQIMDKVRTAGHIATFGKSQLNPFDLYDGRTEDDQFSGIDYDHYAVACAEAEEQGGLPPLVKSERHPVVPSSQHMSPYAQKLGRTFEAWCAADDGRGWCSAMGCKAGLSRRDRVNRRSLITSVAVLAPTALIAAALLMMWWRRQRRALARTAYQRVPVVELSGSDICKQDGP